MDTLPENPKKPPLLKILIPVIAIIALAIGGLTLIKLRTQQNPVNNSAADSGAQMTEEIRAGTVLPDFPLKPLGKDSRTKVSSVSAKVMMINFWATWCEACMVEMPSIVKLRQTYKDKGFEVVSINVDENPTIAVPRALKEFGIEFPVYVDDDQRLAELFNVHGIPLTVIIDKNRKVLMIDEGERDWDASDVKAQLEQWLSG